MEEKMSGWEKFGYTLLIIVGVIMLIVFNHKQGMDYLSMLVLSFLLAYIIYQKIRYGVVFN